MHAKHYFVDSNIIMISEFTKWLIKLRFGIIRFSFNSVVHWDSNQDKLVASQTYRKWTWHLTCFIFTPICSTLLASLLHSAPHLFSSSTESNTYDDDGVDSNALAHEFHSRYGKKAVLYVMVLVICLLAALFTLLIDVMVLNPKSKLELCAFVNGCFLIDGSLTGNLCSRTPKLLQLDINKLKPSYFYTFREYEGSRNRKCPECHNSVTVSI